MNKDIIVDKERLLKIGREYSLKGAKQLGDELGVSKQRIEQIVMKLRKEGAPIPRIRNAKIKFYQEVAEILKKELSQ